MENFKQSNTMEIPKYEENPFEDEQVSQEWIISVEGEKDMGRDRQIYPRLKNWTEQVLPQVLVEIGSGQGICSEKCELKVGKYIGVEPSVPLVNRAKELYSNDNREFLIGNAYQLPIPSETANACFSVNVWFHLENLELASKELSRILKPGGRFMLITANPESASHWESWYENTTKQGKKLVGKAIIPVQSLSKSIFYQHTLEEITEGLENNGLKIEKTETFQAVNGMDIFIEIQGKKE